MSTEAPWDTWHVVVTFTHAGLKGAIAGGPYRDCTCPLWQGSYVIFAFTCLAPELHGIGYSIFYTTGQVLLLNNYGLLLHLIRLRSTQTSISSHLTCYITGLISAPADPCHTTVLERTLTTRHIYRTQIAQHVKDVRPGQVGLHEAERRRG